MIALARLTNIKPLRNVGPVESNEGDQWIPTITCELVPTFNFIKIECLKTTSIDGKQRKDIEAVEERRIEKLGAEAREKTVLTHALCSCGCPTALIGYVIIPGSLSDVIPRCPTDTRGDCACALSPTGWTAPRDTEGDICLLAPPIPEVIGAHGMDGGTERISGTT